MMHMPTTTPVKRNKIRKPKSENCPPPDLRQLVHEIFNQITVMNLCCFKFRVAVAPLSDAQLVSDIERMESATAELTTLLENLADARAPALIASCRSIPQLNASDTVPTTAVNVVSLFKPLRRRR
jgi:hypothetical protein